MIILPEIIIAIIIVTPIIFGSIVTRFIVNNDLQTIVIVSGYALSIILLVLFALGVIIGEGMNERKMIQEEISALGCNDVNDMIIKYPDHEESIVAKYVSRCIILK